MKYIVHTDGAARGNPGPAAIGVVIEDEEGRTVYEASRALGVRTNNEAEYLALITALEYLKEARPKEAEFRLDSELVVKQLSGEYKVKEPRLRALHGQVVMLLNAVPKYKIRHVRRVENARADELANEALDAVG
ncbi:MAG: ribonuclease HI family protein [Candidatus Eisenbacteria bacterium]|uniref:Ribonuclease HI family protein n=1 Tax=Eiseniibacteriota bacterium TaxID=2212470 RepID=A0A538SCQ6_UNCEI|nr:MAG: ribonuclease HI family protein [Candidatus Eisenbacteria bacterium]